MWSVLVSACLLTASVTAGRARRQSEAVAECRDANNYTGTCGTISECPQLNWMFEDGRELLPNEFDYLKNSICRLTSTQYHICCPSTPYTRASWTRENHPNRHLLERGGHCGTNGDPPIVGATELPLGKHPWVAVLTYSDYNNDLVKIPWCGGALISQQHVLTAAHCIPAPDSDGYLYTVLLGEHDLMAGPDRVCQYRNGTRICNNPQNFDIDNIFVHENFQSSNLKNDIALIKLTRPVAEDMFISKICLPFGDVSHRNYTNIDMTTVGFGKLGHRYYSPDDSAIREVTLPGASDEYCREAYKGHRNVSISRSQICAGGNKVGGSCGGDSGDPLVVGTPTGPPYSLIGIMSFGKTHCVDEGIPTVNTRVSEYLNWILDKLDD